MTEHKHEMEPLPDGYFKREAHNLWSPLMVIAEEKGAIDCVNRNEEHLAFQVVPRVCYLDERLKALPQQNHIHRDGYLLCGTRQGIHFVSKCLVHNNVALCV